MPDYRIYTLNRDGRIFARVDAQRNSDEEAIAEARELLALETGASEIEVWERARLVHREVR
jgi:hypothetical protein